MSGINALSYNRSALVENYAIKRSFFLGQLVGNNQDTFSFSTAGMRLNLIYNGQKIKQVSVRSWEPVITGNVGKDADERISQSGKHLERMLELAEAAQDPNLSDQERIEMQMEFGQLQHEMDASNWQFGSARGENKLKSGELRGPYQDTNSYKMLARALDRISNGHEWDVAEVRNTVLETTGGRDDMWLRGPVPFQGDVESVEFDDVRVLYDTEDGWIEYLKTVRPEWSGGNAYFEKPSGDPLGVFSGMPADDDLPLSAFEALGYVWEVTDDATVPTVGEILKGTGRSLMDADAAVVTAEELKKELEGLEKQREQLLLLAAEYAEMQNEPDNSVDKQAVLNKIMQFTTRTLPSFLNTLYRESFQFSFGKKLSVYGQTKEEFENDLAHRQEVARQNSGIISHDLNAPMEFDVPEVRTDGIEILDKQGLQPSEQSA